MIPTSPNMHAFLFWSLYFMSYILFKIWKPFARNLYLKIPKKRTVWNPWALCWVGCSSYHRLTCLDSFIAEPQRSLIPHRPPPLELAGFPREGFFSEVLCLTWSILHVNMWPRSSINLLSPVYNPSVLPSLEIQHIFYVDGGVGYEAKFSGYGGEAADLIAS